MEHPWCCGINWEAVEKRQMDPPFVPSLEEIHFFAKGKGSMAKDQEAETKSKPSINEYITEHVAANSIISDSS